MNGWVDPARYTAFLGAMMVMAFMPGPSNLFSVATGLERGPKAALAGVAGMNLATLLWFGAAALGLGALVLAAPRLFAWVALAGGAYVAWLGGKTLLRAARAAPEAADPLGIAARPSATRKAHHPFRAGFIVQLANPKVVLFFTAVLPPFLDLVRPMAPQMAVFGATAIGMDVVAMTAYGLGGAALARAMTRPLVRRCFDAAVGLMLFSVGLLILARTRF